MLPKIEYSVLNDQQIVVTARLTTKTYGVFQASQIVYHKTTINDALSHELLEVAWRMLGKIRADYNLERKMREEALSDDL
jgi:hypothetical protein